MDMTSVCEAAKPLAHSTPSIRWWLGLNAAEQGAWVSGVGSFAAAAVALVLSLGDQFRRRSDRRARSRVTALYMTPELMRISHFLIEMHTQLLDLTMLPTRNDIFASRKLENVDTCITQVRAALKRIDLEMVAPLPDEIAEPLASGLGGLEFVCDNAESAIKLINTPVDPDYLHQQYKSAAEVVETPMIGLVCFLDWHGDAFPEGKKRTSGATATRIRARLQVTRDREVSG
jgi:hypothetical protein